MSNRIERLKEYANPTRSANWNGSSRNQADLDRWSKRASANSIADDRVPSKPGPKEPSKPGQGDDFRRKANADKNDVGSTFMPGVRRQD
jgi:hypothetical protein